jgi:hypothetical protein
MEKETVQVVAPQGQMEPVAQALIRLADHPHDVVWASRGGYFVVPEDVAVRYAAEQAGELAAAAEAEQTDAAAKPAAKPRSRRRAATKAAAAGDEPATGRRRASRKKKEGGES